MLKEEHRQNLLRLLSSPEAKGPQLALRMLSGMRLTPNDLHWLWEAYQQHSQPKERITLQSYPAISQKERIWGGVLAILLQQEPALNGVWSHFRSHNGLRIPYNTLEQWPASLSAYAPDVEELVWKDGEITQIPAEIRAFRKLRHLDLRRQPIVDIHPHIALLPCLEELHLVSTSFLPDELLERHDVEIHTDAPY